MGNRIAILITLSLVLLPLGYFRGRHEMAAWQGAMAQKESWNGHDPGALEHWNRALEWEPANVDFLRLRAETHVQLGQIDDALDDAKRAFELSPGNDAVLNFYTLSLARAGQHAEAIKLLDDRLKALDSNDVDSLLHFRNGVAYHLALGDRDLDRALKLVNLALVRFPNSADMLDTRGYINLKRGELEWALEDADKAILITRAGLGEEDAAQRLAAMDEQDLARRVKASRQVLAVLLYHRSLIHAARAEKAKEEDRPIFEASAALDRAEIRKLGFVADERLL
jgi:tetratricopeptide (TPR) repeat protein